MLMPMCSSETGTACKAGSCYDLDSPPRPGRSMLCVKQQQQAHWQLLLHTLACYQSRKWCKMGCLQKAMLQDGSMQQDMLQAEL